MNQVLDDQLLSSGGIANLKGIIQGSTLMHTMLYSGNFELLEKLIKACPNQDNVLERAIRGKAMNEEDNQHLKIIIAIMEAKKEELKNKKPVKVWSEQPMFKALNQERFGLLGIFLLLGGNINTRTDGGSASLFDRLLQKILEKPEVAGANGSHGLSLG